MVTYPTGWRFASRAGGWTCSGAVGQCSNIGHACAQCTGDVYQNGACTGGSFGSGTDCVLTGSAIECAKCTSCKITAGVAACAARGGVNDYAANTRDMSGPDNSTYRCTDSANLARGCSTNELDESASHSNRASTRWLSFRFLGFAAWP